MQFKDYPYTRPEEKPVLEQMEAIRVRLEQAKNYDEFFEAFKDFNQLNIELDTLSNIAYVRHTIDTRDKFYADEWDYLNELVPVVDNKESEIIRTILASPFVEELKKDVPHTWFARHEMTLKTIDPKIVDDLRTENKLQASYQNLVASAQIEFDGKTWTLAGLEEKMNDSDEEVRRRAHKAYWGWYADHEEEIGKIYDGLVKIRTQIAQKMGYENYIPFGYLRMNRIDYDLHDVENYRKNILRDVVPAAQELYAAKAKRLGIEGNKLPVWDEKVTFLSGNARPHFDTETMVDHALKMYQELSPETGEFFQLMIDNDAMDLEAKPGKAAGGYCTSFAKYKAPFIFSNFNKTQHDAEVLTHEAGHAFQNYMSRDIFPADCVWPTMESCEIDSMSMEFFTWPWMEGFFEDDADKYRYAHLGGCVEFLPYGVLVDHFQHEVYAHPEWTHAERMNAWRTLEKQYLPHKDYSEIDVLERGGWWMRQLHIFLDPFYYIDYTLAQVAALQFWSRLMKKDPEVFKDYLKLCKAGGTLSFTELIRLANLKVPFEDGCLSQTMGDVRNYVKDWNETHPEIQ